jgi:hypothetical protein
MYELSPIVIAANGEDQKNKENAAGFVIKEKADGKQIDIP